MSVRIIQAAVPAVVASLACTLASAASLAPSPASDAIKDFLVDVGSGPVSAADLIGVSASAVTNVQSLKDFNALLSPGAGGDQQVGVGLQVTPARTRWSPLTARQYIDHDWARLLGAVSLSYAQNKATYDNVDYQQQAAAVHLSYYFHPADDPIVAAHAAFDHCDGVASIQGQVINDLKARVDNLRHSLGLAPDALIPVDQLAKVNLDYEKSDDFSKLKQAVDSAVVKCAGDNARDTWNAPQVAATFGGAWIRPEAGGNHLTLARSASINVVLPASTSGAFNLVARIGRHEVDTNTLTTSPVYRDRSLFAGRYTYRGAKDSDLFGIAEVSNAHGSDGTLSNSLFKYALGIDKRLLEGVWLEFRVGRARSSNGTSEETKALFAFKWSATPALPTLFASKP